jgi:hypothetical protein
MAIIYRLSKMLIWFLAASLKSNGSISIDNSIGYLLHSNALIDFLQHIGTNSRKQRSKCDPNIFIYQIMLGYENVQIYILFYFNDKINDNLWRCRYLYDYDWNDHQFILNQKYFILPKPSILISKWDSHI